MTTVTDQPNASENGAAPVDAPMKKPGAAKVRPGALAESGGPMLRPPSAAHLSDEQVAELGRELDAIRDDILAKRGASDAAYIRRMIKIQRGLRFPAARHCWSARTRRRGSPAPRC